VTERLPLERSDDRRELIEQRLGTPQAVSGIDAVEVLDSQAPPGTPRQRTLLVSLFDAVPATFSAANVAIEGGVRVKDIQVAWAFAAPRFEDASIPNEVISLAEQASLASYLLARYPDPTERARQLVVRTGSGSHDWEGDLSQYRLRLVAGAGDPTVPDGFDPKFSVIDFRFKVECPKDADCVVTEACPPDILGAPRIDYLAKDYQSFRRLMLDRLAVLMPEWRDRRAADVGMMLVEVVAYAADHLSYYQDAVATEAYLGTARRRTSVRRHARLLDYAMHDGCNARAWVTIESRAPDGNVIPAGALLCTRQPSADTVVDISELEPGTVLFETLHPLTLREAHNRIALYAWASRRWFLPKGATRATLEVKGAPLALEPGDVLVLEEVLGPEGETLTADSRRRHAVRLTEVAPEQTDPLTGVAYVEVSWAAADALPFALCVATVAGEAAFSEMSVARGNVVLVDSGYWVAKEELPAPPSGRIYRPALGRLGVTCSAPYNDAAARAQPAAVALLQDPRAALPCVRMPGTEWTVARDLLESTALDANFVVEIESDGSARLRFGDGVNGKSAPDTPLEVDYRVAGGSADNVGAEAIGHFVRDPSQTVDFSSVVSLRNPLPAAGGTDGESIADVRQNAPEAFRTQRRAVTETDYSTAAVAVSGVRGAVARRRWTGSWYTVFLSIDRAGGEDVDEAFAESVRAAIEPLRMAGEDLEIDGPIHVPLEVVMEVCVAPGYFRSDVRRALADVFSSAPRADGSLGFFAPDRFGFGDSVFLSQIVAAAMRVPGVLWVDVSDSARGHRFRRFGKPDSGEMAAGVITLNRLEIARADSSPNFPERGRVDFILEGGL
jgi:hypothetical protein